MPTGIYPRKPMSEETKRKIGLANKGRSPWSKGKERSAEAVKKMIETRRKNGTYNFSEEWKRNIGLSALGRTPWNKGKQLHYSVWNKGKKLGPNPVHSARMKGRRVNDALKKYNQAHGAWNKGVPNYDIRGEKHPNWQGGITPINMKIRRSFEYKIWRRAVFKRDKYTCIWCGSRKKIEADHIKPFSRFPELRFVIDNGRTLCRECHRKTDTWGNKSIMSR